MFQNPSTESTRKFYELIKLACVHSWYARRGGESALITVNVAETIRSSDDVGTFSDRYVAIPLLIAPVQRQTHLLWEPCATILTQKTWGSRYLFWRRFDRQTCTGSASPPVHFCAFLEHCSSRSVVLFILIGKFPMRRT